MVKDFKTQMFIDALQNKLNKTSLSDALYESEQDSDQFTASFTHEETSVNSVRFGHFICLCTYGIRCVQTHTHPFLSSQFPEYNAEKEKEVQIPGLKNIVKKASVCQLFIVLK